ncbi:MAG: glycolate oxidase subunit GlcE [Pseudomonadota bacterium]
MVDRDDSADLIAQVNAALERAHPLAITGGGSKAFLGRQTDRHGHETLSTVHHAGIVNYQPTELTLTARAGTPLADIRAALDEADQALPFEPPALDGAGGTVATLGGTLACGLSGQTRPFAGSCRDYVLGVRVINGRGQALRFGGEVMKNVAGYDLSRLMVGALGTFGVLLEGSLKVLPKAPVTRSFRAACSAEEALAFASAARRTFSPLSGLAFHGGTLHYRLAGSESAVDACSATLNARLACDEDTGDHWTALNEQTLPFFDDTRPLWRLAVPPGTGVLSLPGDTLIDWCGQQRWLLSDADADTVQAAARAAGGHATRFRRGEAHVFQDVPAAHQALLHRLKAAFDPQGVFNPGRLLDDA